GIVMLIASIGGGGILQTLRFTRIALVSTFLMPQGHGKSPVQALWVDLLEPYLQMPFQGPLAMASRTALARSTIKHLQKWAVIWAQYLHDQASRCPDQRFVLSGVSKGAMLIHSMFAASSLLYLPHDRQIISSKPR
ncbi:unnamed protein product, partial [Rhizoctonia solani]